MEDSWVLMISQVSTILDYLDACQNENQGLAMDLRTLWRGWR